MPTTSPTTASTRDSESLDVESFWPRGLQEWLQIAMLAGVFFGMVVPAIVHYWLGIQRLGGFWYCLREFSGG